MVYDLFQVVARFGRKVVDRVRVDQANELRKEPKARQINKRSRWLLLPNQGNLDDGQAVRIDELLSANAPLAKVYLLRTAVKELRFAPTISEGRKRWREWFRLALDSGLVPAIQFAK